ncbi:MAG TPA: thiamine pyrophosphate-dependent enzyme [Limnochordales bacterium]
MTMSRFQATQALLELVDKEPIVSSLGRTTFDLHGAKDRPENFYLFGAMGMASSVALGLARSMPQTKVISLEGDGALLMNLGSLVTIGVLRPANLVLIVWDNEEYESTGGQKTHTARGADLERLARAAGIDNTATVRDLDSFKETARRALATPGPWLIVAKVKGDGVKRRVPRKPVWFKERFQAAMAELRAQAGGV